MQDETVERLRQLEQAYATAPSRLLGPIGKELAEQRDAYAAEHAHPVTLAGRDGSA
jgi:hypothetical protein